MIIAITIYFLLSATELSFGGVVVFIGGLFVIAYQVGTTSLFLSMIYGAIYK